MAIYTYIAIYSHRNEIERTEKKIALACEITKMVFLLVQ